MKTIYKYELKIQDKQFIEVTGFNGILKVAEQNGVLCIWCLINKKDESVCQREINIVGTGNPIHDEIMIHQGSYFDSVLMSNGLVWHIFT